ncbi:MAG: choice-of-anchor R domain-containing protein, partial [Deltaproteobacteria bacterium]|nr:choice-of-anchor R domain-containing protein [Deltaproteobacteria bacterium]
MIALPAKFAEENGKGVNTPSLLVRLLEQEVSNEQTTQAEWQANTGEGSVDYATSPGDVILALASVPNEEQTGHDASAAVYSTTGLQGPFYHEAWQSFRQHTSTAKVLSSVTVKITTQGGGGTLNCELWSAAKGGKIGSTVSLSIPYNVTNYDMAFDFSAQGSVLTSSTEYWLKLYVTGTMDGSSLPQCYVRYNTATSSYADGQFDYYPSGGPWEYNKGDLYFIITMTGDYYQPSGYIRTQSMDLGETPLGTGEWVLENVEPPGTLITYQAWASATGAFTGEEVSLGSIQDGDPITVLKRYYRVRADLSTTDGSFTPTLQSVKASFEIFTAYADNLSMGYEPSILDVSSLTTTVDTFS